MPDSLVKIKVIKGDIKPKSINSSGLGQFLIANPQYHQSVVVFSHEFQQLNDFNDSLFYLLPPISKANGSEKQVPIHACFSHFGKYAWIASYPLLSSGSIVPSEERCEDIYRSPSGYVLKLNTLTSSVEASIPLGKFPTHLIATPDHRYLIASNSCSKDIHIIDSQTNTIRKHMVLGSYPQGLATDAHSTKLFVTLTESSSIAVIDLNSFQIQKFPLGPRENPMYVQVNPSGNTLFVSLAATGELAQYEYLGDSLLLRKKVYTGRSPRSLAITPDASFVYVANYLSKTVSKVRTEDLKVVDSIRLSHPPTDIAFDPSSGQLWVASYQNRNIIVYEDRDYRSSQSISTGQNTLQSFDYSIEKLNTHSTKGARGGFLPIPSKQINQLSQSQDTLIHLILGSFTEKENAHSYLKDLRQKGIEAFILPSEKGSYRIGVGKYSNRREARSAAAQMKEVHGISSWLKIRELP